MLLWHGTAGSPDAQYGNMEVEGLGYAPCVTSAQELSASGWNRAHEVVTGRDIARALFPDRWGIWLNPHAPGGGVGIPWLDLRRIATGLDRMPAGPLRLTEPAIELPQFYALLAQNAHRTSAVRVAAPRLGAARARRARTSRSGSTSTTPARPSVDAVRAMMQQSIGVVPEGLPVSTVAHVRRVRPRRDVAAGQLPPVLRPRGTRPGTRGPGYGYPPAAGPAPHAY